MPMTIYKKLLMQDLCNFPLGLLYGDEMHLEKPIWEKEIEAQCVIPRKGAEAQSV